MDPAASGRQGPRGGVIDGTTRSLVLELDDGPDLKGHLHLHTIRVGVSKHRGQIEKVGGGGVEVRQRVDLGPHRGDEPESQHKRHGSGPELHAVEDAVQGPDPISKLSHPIKKCRPWDVPVFGDDWLDMGSGYHYVGQCARMVSQVSNTLSSTSSRDS